jgi:ATP-dependent protease ClpP protease subunit
MSKWYDIRGAADAPEIWIYGDIGDSWYDDSVTAAQFVKDIQAITADAITVRINSYGGSVSDGLAIYNAIKRHTAKVTTAIDGVAMSSASLIAMAGDTVQMCANALLMIHAPWSVVAGNSSELRVQADVLDTYAKGMAASYMAKSGKSQDEILALLTDGKDHYYTATEALAEGFADSIVADTAIAASADFRVAAMARFTKSPNPAAPAALETVMTPEEKLAAEAKAKADAQAALDAQAAALKEASEKAAAEALAADAVRRTAIEAHFKPYIALAGMKDLQDKALADPKTTAEAAGLQVLAKLGEGAEPVGSFRITDSDAAERFKRDASACILVKAGLANEETRKIAANAKQFKSFKLLDFARASLDRAGIQHGHMDQRTIVGTAFTSSTSDFPILLENTMHKVLLDAYATTPDTWSKFCQTGSVTDFRAHPRYRAGSLGNLDTIGELSEFKEKSIPDGEKGSITATTKGNIINISRQMIINDDMGAFLGLPTNLGRAAKRTVEAAVYSLLAQNSGLGPTMGDGQTLFYARTNGNNIGTGAALSAASIDADRVVMAAQMDVGGNDFLSLTPAILLLPSSLGGQARVINKSEYDPDTVANKAQMKPNVSAGLYREIVDTPRLGGTRRYSFADPSVAPVIEVAFLDGMMEPFLEMQLGFSVDGTQYKVRLDFGVAAIDYRGAVTNAGV